MGRYEEEEEEGSGSRGVGDGSREGGEVGEGNNQQPGPRQHSLPPPPLLSRSRALSCQEGLVVVVGKGGEDRPLGVVAFSMICEGHLASVDSLPQWVQWLVAQNHLSPSSRLSPGRVCPWCY